MHAMEGGFTLQRPIGVGAMGEVWRATAPDGTPVAMKVAKPEMRDNPLLLRLMEGEVRALARLDHPRVAWLYDHGRTSAHGPFAPGCPYLVLEYCSGGTLADRTIEDWGTAREVLVGLLQALAHAHAHGIVHRDLKPANVLWAGSTDLRPGMKLADFSVAYAMDAAENAARVGTGWYMAPEQAASPSQVGPWTDLYALGALGWELVTGDPPSKGPSELQPLFPVPEALETWLRSLLEPDPTRRARHAASALASLARLDPLVPTPEEDWRSPGPRGPRLRLQGAGLNLVALREPDLAGRSDERGSLWADLQTVRAESRIRVVVMRGISGIGKSRLGRWLVTRSAELGLAESVVVGCREGEALASLLAGLLRVATHGPERIDAVLAALTARDPAAAQRLEPLLRSPSRPWGTMPLIRRLLCADLRPRILLLDDAHHSLCAVRLARALLRDGSPAPLLVLLAVEEESLGRDADLRDQVDGLCDSEGVRTLTVGPLTAAEQEELLKNLVGLDPESQSAVLARAGGHPGTLVAQVTSWAGLGVLAPSGRGFRLVADEGTPAPSWSSIWAHWMEEWLALLDEDDQLLLEQAAVIGRAVDETLWESVTDDADARLPFGRVQLDIRAARRRAALVNRLIGAGLAYDTDVGFTFTHPALVEVLVERARASGRLAAHHRACANHLRRMPLPDHALALGHHLAEAQVWDEAAIAILDGIAFHWQFRDRRPLLTELERAERCVAAAGWPEDDPRRSQLLHTRALLLVTAGRPDEGSVLARQAYAMATRSGDRAQMARTVWRLVDTLVVASRWDDARQVIPLFLELEDTQLEPHHGGLARVRMGRCLLAAGDEHGAETWFAEAEQVLLAGPRSLYTLGSMLEMYDFTERYELIFEVGAELEVMAAEEGRTDLQLFAMSKQVEACLNLKRFEPGLSLARRCLDLNDQLGDQRFALYMRVELGVLELRDGRIAEALLTLTEVLQDLDRRQSTWLAMTALLARADCALALDDLDCYDRDLSEVAQLVASGRYERDAVQGRLVDLRDRLVGRGLLSRAEGVDGLLGHLAALASTDLDVTAPI